jgi:hypothetical protein
MIAAMKRLLLTVLASFTGQATAHDWELQHIHFSPEVLLLVALLVAIGILAALKGS